MLKIFDVLISLLMLINSFIYKLKVRVESSRFFYFFKPLDTDIYIASYMKSGTTLTQVMLFEILNKKNLDYSNINDVSPFLDDSRSDSWFKHVKQWRTNKNITYLQYEDVVTDLGAAAEKLADFIGVELTEEQKAQVVERCRFDRMKKEEKK